MTVADGDQHVERLLSCRDDGGDADVYVVAGRVLSAGASRLMTAGGRGSGAAAQPDCTAGDCRL